MINYDEIQEGDFVKIVSSIPARFAKEGTVCKVVEKTTLQNKPAVKIQHPISKEINTFFDNCGAKMLEKCKFYLG